MGNTQQSKPSDQTAIKNNRIKLNTSNPQGNQTDSSSEISDEGYRTTIGVGDPKNDELDERPDSSCTQVSQSSSLESGVSSAGPLDDADTPPPPTNYKPDKTESIINNKYSKIPLLGSLRAMGNKGGSFHYSTGESNNSSRKSSIDSDRSLSNPALAGFRRDVFGRHSLRARSTINDYDKFNATASSKTGIDSTDQSPTSKNTLTWSGRNRRQRPTIQPELTFRNRNTAALVGSTTTPPGTSYRSRSVNSGASRGQSRASSTSPSSRRRNVFIGSSSGYGAPLSPEIKPIPHLKFSKHQIHQPSNNYGVKQPISPQHSPQPESPKISPLLRNMLKEVELDNDASILKKMEEIVNQYKARVESILAAEGKTLNDDLDLTSPTSNNGKVDLMTNGVRQQLQANDQDELRKMKPKAGAPGLSKLSRRNSLDSSLSHMPTRMFPSPRKDIVSQSPSKIPMPRFYRPKETCL